MTEKEKMLAGKVYDATAPELIAELKTTREILYEYNSLRPSETKRMKVILKDLLGHVADDEFIINQPFRCDYGKQISIGKRFFANFNFTVLDEASVTIGDDCFIGPNVSIYTACHSTDPVERNSRNRSRILWLGISWNFHSYKPVGGTKKQEEDRSVIKLGE